MKLSEKSWQRIRPVYDKILAHPFIRELMDGTLAEEKFLFYIQQDALYLSEYGKALEFLALKLKKAAHSQAFASFAKDCILVENALHDTYLGGGDMGEESPSCMLYTSYIFRQLQTASVEEAVAAVLPCFWIYKEVGDYILENQPGGSNRYQAWIDTYGSAEFAEAVKKAVDIYDELAETSTPERQESMMNIFVICSKMEWIFWDSAYRLEKWPV